MAPLDAEEQSLLESIELGEWQSVPNVLQEIERYQHYARVQLAGMESVNLELSSRDLQALQAFAKKSGTSVSALMATVLHQFATSLQE